MSVAYGLNEQRFRRIIQGITGSFRHNPDPYTHELKNITNKELEDLRECINEELERRSSGD